MARLALALVASGLLAGCGGALGLAYAVSHCNPAMLDGFGHLTRTSCASDNAWHKALAAHEREERTEGYALVPVRALSDEQFERYH